VRVARDHPELFIYFTDESLSASAPEKERKSTQEEREVKIMSFDIDLTSYRPNLDQNMTFFRHDLVSMTSN